MSSCAPHGELAPTQILRCFGPSDSQLDSSTVDPYGSTPLRYTADEVGLRSVVRSFSALSVSLYAVEVTLPRTELDVGGPGAGMAFDTEPCASSARRSELGTEPASRNSTRIGCRRSIAQLLTVSCEGAGSFDSLLWSEPIEEPIERPDADREISSRSQGSPICRPDEDDAGVGLSTYPCDSSTKRVTAGEVDGDGSASLISSTSSGVAYAGVAYATVVA
mmetsp:Transcript_21891/g.66459  ORF Transcript_21891/g.66459 Transcript_21891/m.66459 type:complete len:220 (-) Transcript_21891:1619-2278(-)